MLTRLSPGPRCCSAHRRRVALRVSCGIITVLVGLGAVAICVWQLVDERNFSGVVATAGAAVVAAVLISASEIFQHMANYSRPALQKQIVRVLLMVPVYSAASFLSLALPVAGPYLDVVRELYEALTIYAFTWFVLAYLELDANLSFASFGEILASKPPLPHMWPLGALLRPWQMGTPFIRNVQTGVLNYVVVRPITAVIGFALSPFGLYTAGDVDPGNAYIYLAFVNSLSQGWALYCLIMLYRATHTELAGIKVLSKFLCVKGVVFFTYWQGVAVAIGIRVRAIQSVIKPHGHDSEAELATRLQNFITCVEMLFFALAHSYAFSAREYWTDAGPGSAPPRSVWAAAAMAFDWSDVGHNMVGQVHLGATELLDGAQSAGRGVLDGAAWPFQQLRKQLGKARSSDGGVATPAAGRREAKQALLPDARTAGRS